MKKIIYMYNWQGTFNNYNTPNLVKMTAFWLTIPRFLYYYLTEKSVKCFTDYS